MHVSWRSLRISLHKKMSSLEFLQDCSFQYFGGVREIRTLAGLATSNDLANRPLQPLEYHSMRQLTILVYYNQE